MRPLFNSLQPEYKTPFGAVKSGEEVYFTLRVPLSYGCTQPVFLLQTDAGSVQSYPMTYAGQEDDATLFTLTLCAPACGLYFYWFDLWINYQKLYRGAQGNAVVSTEEGEKYVLVVYDPAFTTPAAFHGSVMYQIFPDRFLEGNPNRPHPYPERIYRTDKHNEPFFWSEQKSYGSLTQDYFGGDLAGIVQRLPFLHALGIRWIYLNPIFEAHSNHRYNTADYLKVDPYLGTNEEFAQLCREALAYDIRIILDGVFSHTGSDSIYFNREGRYPEPGAWQDVNSPYRSWFSFHEDGTYDSWWGFETLPASNKNNADYRQFFTGEGGVIDYWLQLGAAGFRLDVADELPDSFIREIRTAVKRNGDDKLLIGEVWEDAALKEAYHVRRQYFLGHELDGVMNYPFRTAILQFLKQPDATAFEESVLSVCEHYPLPALCACTTHLSTHDTLRAITALAGEDADGRDRCWQSGRTLSPEQYTRGIGLMRLAMVLQFTLPGVPCVYYGDEIAMQGYADPFNRGYYNWHSSENRLMPLIIRLAELRRSCSAFAQGSIHFTPVRKDVLLYERKDGNTTAAIAVNAGTTSVIVYLLGKEIQLPAGGFALNSSHGQVISG